MQRVDRATPERGLRLVSKSVTGVPLWGASRSAIASHLLAQSEPGPLFLRATDGRLSAVAGCGSGCRRGRGRPSRATQRVREGGEVSHTITLDRGCFARMLGGANRATLFILAAEWRGPSKTFEAPRTGVVIRAPVPVGGAGVAVTRGDRRPPPPHPDSDNDHRLASTTTEGSRCQS
jgi:hypothetical protein